MSFAVETTRRWFTAWTMLSVLLAISFFTSSQFASAQIVRSFNATMNVMLNETTVPTNNKNASHYTVGVGPLNLELWSPYGQTTGGDTAANVLMTAAQEHVRNTRDKNGNDTITWTIRLVGFTGTGTTPICGTNQPCPDVMIVGSTQVAYRYAKGDLLGLETFMQKHFYETGRNLPDDFTKFTYYDYFLDNRWAALPYVTETRLLFFNRTTFTAAGLKFPPPYADWGPNYWTSWNWTTFAEYARIIKEKTGLPGFNFAGGFDEEDKLVSTVIRNYGLQIVKGAKEAVDDGAILNPRLTHTCGLTNQTTVLDSVINNVFKKMYVTDNSTNPLLVQDANFTAYMADDNYSGILNAQPKNPFPFNGMVWGATSFVPLYNSTIGLYLTNSTSPQGVAFPPGQSTFLGGAGLTITRLSKNPNLAWGLMKILIDPAKEHLTRAAKAIGSPPPYDSIALYQSPWTDDSWSIHRQMLSRAAPMFYPQPTNPSLADMEAKKPFRRMLADLIYKNKTRTVATDSFCTTMNAIVAPACTSQDWDIQVSECSPSQTRSASYVWKQPKVCAGNDTLLPQQVEQLSCSYVHIESQYSKVMTGLISFGIATSVVYIILMLVLRNKPSVRRTSPIFNIIVLLGAILMYTSVYMWRGEPTNGACLSRVWLLALGFCLFMSAILVKLWRVYKVFSVRRLESKQSLDDWRLFQMLGMLVLIEVACLLFATFYDQPRSILEIKQLSLSTLTYPEAKCSQSNVVTTGVLLCVNFTLLLFTVYVSYIIRQIPPEFNEDRVVGITVYAATLTAIIAGAALFAVSGSTNPEVSFLIYAVAIFASVLFTTTLLCVPKFLGSGKPEGPNTHASSKKGKHSGPQAGGHRAPETTHASATHLAGSSHAQESRSSPDAENEV